MSEISEITEGIPEENPGENPGENSGEDPGTDPGTGPGEQPGSDPAPPVSASVLNLAVEAVMDMIDAMNLYAEITRGPLGVGNSLSCEIAPSRPGEVYLDKNAYIPLTLALNGKHTDLRVLSDTLNTITDTLSRKTSYTSGTGWQIVDITSGNLPRIIGREDHGCWLMACDVVVKIYRKED